MLYKAAYTQKQTMQETSNQPGGVIPIRRTLLVLALALILSSKVLWNFLLPFGPAIKIPSGQRISFAKVDPSNDSLQAKHGKLSKIYERRDKGGSHPPLMDGLETVFFDDNGTMYTINNAAQLIKWSDVQPDENDSSRMLATPAIVVPHLGNGRPLGATFGRDGKNTLYIADAILGVTRIRNLGREGQSKLEVLASGYKNNKGVWTPFSFVDDVAVGPKTGKVYFTEASSIPPIRDSKKIWDAMYSGTLSLIQGNTHGRLFAYDPKTDEVETLVPDGMAFANGVTVSQDETYLLVSETIRMRVMKFYLTGEKKGTFKYIVDGDPHTGYTDNVDCAWKGVTADTSLCYVVHISRIVPASAILARVPHPIDLFLRTILLMLPKPLLPKLPPYAGLSVIDADKEEHITIIQDPDGRDVHHLTGVTVHKNKLYLGSLRNNYIGVYDLSK